MKDKRHRGWFTLPGHKGDRTLEQQTKGLDAIDFKGKTVLDVGCAEGVLSLWCLGAGAKYVRGIDIRRDFIVKATQLALDAGVYGRTAKSGRMARFAVVDINKVPKTPAEKPVFDIVLMLGVLHKVTDPSFVCRQHAALARETVVIRLPPDGAPVITHPNNGNVPHDIGAVMDAAGFDLVRVTRGSFDEWTGHYVRTQ
jgi:2-polyprenyl-3-methyl-5-hydroxy-6-metoxy-1,4-benzoquinol methylase